MSAPAFLNKPKHKDNVIATPKGWVVEKTGELLVSVKNLDQRIAEHLGLPTFKFQATFTPDFESEFAVKNSTELEAAAKLLADEVDAEMIAAVNALSAGAPVTAAASLDNLLDSLDTTKTDEVVKDVVEDVVKEVTEETPTVVVEKKKRGGYRPRKPKVDA
jgi:hypothetical protein